MTYERSCEQTCKLHAHAHTHAKMHHVFSKLENAVSLRASMPIVPPIIVHMLIAAKRAIFYAWSAAICVATQKPLIENRCTAEEYSLMGTKC
jgi:hypothetical protein